MHQRAMLQRGVAALLMTLQLGGCTYWRVESLPPTVVVERHQPAVVRVQSGDGPRQVVYRPEIRRDSLVGTRSYESKRQDRAFALAGVTQVETHHVSADRTAALVMGIGAVAFAAIMIALSGMQGL
jgi:hypothetical protein